MSDETSATLAPAVPSSLLDAALRTAFLVSCGVLAFALSAAPPWRMAGILAATGLGASWGALAPPLPAAPASSPAPPWSARRVRAATLLLAAPLVVVAAWAWAGAPDFLPHVRLPAVAGVSGGAAVLLAATVAAALALGVLRRRPGLALRGLGLVGAGLVIIGPALVARGTRTGDLAWCAVWWLNVAVIARPVGSRWLGASVGAAFGSMAGRSLLDLLASLAP